MSPTHKSTCHQFRTAFHDFDVCRASPSHVKLFSWMDISFQASLLQKFQVSDEVFES